MNVSQACIDLIKSFESYGKALADGRCIAYRCKIKKLPDGTWKHDGKWTIGWGCTEGVTEGMIWTREEAEAALLREIRKHVNAVNRVVTVELGQHAFDALVSFSYNVGAAALAGSTLLRKLNAGDVQGAAREFGRFIYSQGEKVPGLITRRAREAALFLEGMTAATVPNDEPAMPQDIDVPTVDADTAHKAAHRQLKDESPWYRIKAQVLEFLGLAPKPLAAGAVGVTAAGIEPAAVSAWRLPSLSTIENAMTLVGGYGFKLLLVGLAIAVVLEWSNLSQRQPIVENNA